MLRPSLVLALAVPTLLAAQPFAIGSRTLTFTDPTRGGRQIPCEVFYPATTAGANTPVATGRFPVLAFGHGFVMTVGAYANFRDAFVPEGFILVLPTTEGGFLPSHGNFGLDLAFVVGAMRSLDTDAGSPFFGRVFPTSAVLGHSMGGGASFLGAASSPLVTTVVNFAPAETNPSAIAAAATVTVPTLVFAGSEDCVTPAASNQLPMYTSSGSACKAYVSITGGGHCYFANSNFNCSFGETTCGGPGSLTRAQQQDAAQDLALLWLKRYLKDDPAAGDAFADSLAVSPRITAQSVFTDCPPVVVRAQLRVLLDGPYDEAADVMEDALRAQGLIPAVEPSSAAGFVHLGAGAGQALDPALLTITGPDAVVDWVFLELRDAATGGTVLATANGLVQRDGDVVAPDGGTPEFATAPGSYRIAVRHRNHLGACLASAIALTREPAAVDLSDPQLPVFGTDARRLRDGRALLWSGNALRDAELRYTGAQNDRDAMLLRIGGVVPTASVTGYWPEDVGLDGRVRYAGAGNDRDRLLISIGGAVPTAVRTEQLP
ncbi:MAG: dienelactone hydrolase family protein [Flavobacteriales bacterium]|nr:dienelactone hydrolase family protein [Flavobacteriales bacterium]